MAGAVIRFVCRNNAHRRMTSDVSNPVTLHGQEWAFCPAGVAEDHTWERIEGATLAELRLRAVETTAHI
ncbi:MAG TPA: hypothetical protein VJP45_11385 [Candidatus Limnocylindria bacterium]|nr:hypothetical protein [Candidatus Limnocylindria bacterium]